MVRLLFLLYSISFFAAEAQRENPFQLNKNKELVISSLGILSTSIGYLHNQQIASLTETQIQNLNIDDIPSYERIVINYHSEKAAMWSDIGQYVSIGLPFSFLVFHPSKKESLVHLIMLQEVLGLTIGVSQLTKGITLRTRPYAYNPNISLQKKTTSDARFSLFSGHTSFSSALGFFSASVISAYSENNTLKTFSWIGAATLPAAVGLLRVHSGEHFYSDVIVGYLVGGGIGWLIPQLHKNNNNSVSLLPYFYPNTSGVSLCFKF